MPDADVFTMKRNDTRPKFKSRLTQADPLAPETQISVDLTAATAVKFIMREESSVGSAKVNAAAVITDAANGRVEYTWTTGDTDTAGTYNAEWEVSWGGDKQTFPSEGYLVVIVEDDLG
jgi:hypothetical protein